MDGCQQRNIPSGSRVIRALPKSHGLGRQRSVLLTLRPSEGSSEIFFFEDHETATNHSTKIHWKSWASFFCCFSTEPPPPTTPSQRHLAVRGGPATLCVGLGGFSGLLWTRGSLGESSIGGLVHGCLGCRPPDSRGLLGFQKR